MNHSQWFESLREEMRFAFGDRSPALVTMFWFNREIKKSLCDHRYYNGEDGPQCQICGFYKWDDLPMSCRLDEFKEAVGSSEQYDESTNPSNGWRVPQERQQFRKEDF